jgi:hypothetical protein
MTASAMMKSSGDAMSAGTVKAYRSQLGKKPGDGPDPQQLICPGIWNGREFLPCRGLGDYARPGNAPCTTCMGSGLITPAKARALGEELRRAAKNGTRG